MKKQPQTLIWMVTAILSVATFVFAQETVTPNTGSPTTTGTITKVTVYRGQALVTRSIDVDLPPGASELIVKDLPPKILPESLYAQTSGNINVLSVRYRQEAVKEDTREEVRILDGQIEDVKHTLKYAEGSYAHLASQWEMFAKLKDFTITAAKDDLNRGLLVFEPIQKLTALIEEKGLAYHQNKMELEDEIAQLKKELELLTRRRESLTNSRSRTKREAVLFVSKNGNDKGTIELSYLVSDANWQQQYNLRANPDEATVLIEYNAILQQTSGENWGAVDVSLSTAEPTLVAAPPVLEPLSVVLSFPVPVQQVETQQQVEEKFDKVREYQKSRKSNIKMGIAANEELNRLASESQTFILQASGRELEQFKEELAVIARNEGVSVTYNLPGKLSLPSRSDQQLVTITSIHTKADFTLIATPLLTDYVYLQADLFNDSDTVLLPGPASMFRNGEFVGKSQLPLVTIGEKFTGGFGIDSQIQVSRELKEKKTRIQGGNRIDTYRYRIALSNYKNTPVELQLLDRLPHSDDSSIKIGLEETTPALSEDAEYLHTAREKGILRWDLELKGDTTGENATVVEYSFTMEYDKNMKIQPR